MFSCFLFLFYIKASMLYMLFYILTLSINNTPYKLFLQYIVIIIFFYNSIVFHCVTLWFIESVLYIWAYKYFPVFYK